MIEDVTASAKGEVRADGQSVQVDRSAVGVCAPGMRVGLAGVGLVLADGDVFVTQGGGRFVAHGDLRIQQGGGGMIVAAGNAAISRAVREPSCRPAR